MEGFEHNLHIAGGAFESMRRDADRVLQKLLKNMVEKESLEGSVTIKIDVSLTQEFIENTDPEIDDETRKVLSPAFTHKVGSMMQIKDEAKGGIHYEEMEMVWDEELKEYIVKPIVNTTQRSIFDADFRCVNDPDEEEGEMRQQMAIEGKCVAALPGSCSESTTEKGPKKCTTGWSRYGTCNCCGNNGATCCAQCNEDCNSRCGWIDEPYIPEEGEETQEETVEDTPCGEDMSDTFEGMNPPEDFDPEDMPFADGNEEDGYGYDEPGEEF